MSRDFFYRWRTTISVVFAVLIFLSTVGYSISRTNAVSNKNAVTVQALVDERVESRVAECRGQAEFRTVFPATLRKIAVAASAQRGIDLTSFPEYVALTDPRTADYLRALEERLNQAPERDQPDIVTQAAIDYERENPVPDCKQVEREVREELSGS